MDFSKIVTTEITRIGIAYVVCACTAVTLIHQCLALLLLFPDIVHCNRISAGFPAFGYSKKKPGALKRERPAIFIDYASDQFAFWAFLAAFWAFLKSL